MTGIWVACCDHRRYAQLAEEVRGRDATARVLRCGAADDAVRIVLGMPGGVAGAVFLAGDGREDPGDAIGRVARSGRAGQILVLLERLDPASIERLFQAGATEVIAAEGCDTVSPEQSGRRRAKGEASGEGAGAGEAAVRCDDVPLEVPPWQDPEVEAEERYAARLTAWEEYAPAAPADPPWDEAAGCGGQRVGGQDGAPAVTLSLDRARMRAVARASRGVSAEGAARRRAPVITAISGRGGVGKTTLLAAMAASAARMGVRSAVLDLDLMFGNMFDLMGVDEPADLAVIRQWGAEGPLDADIEASAMRVGPGLTLWGPIAVPEQAELMGPSCEQLIESLRGLADAIFVDTSVYWGDAVAAAVASCDRCLVVGGAPSSCAPAARAVELATRLGVPRTKMTSVVNRFGSRACGEEHALRYELAVSLRSKERIADGGDEVSGMSSFGRMDELVAGGGPFARSVTRMTTSVLKELGCTVADLDEDAASASDAVRPRLRLPWRKTGEAA